MDKCLPIIDHTQAARITGLSLKVTHHWAAPEAETGVYDCVFICSVIDGDVIPPQFTQRLVPVTVVKGDNTKLCAAITGKL